MPLYHRPDLLPPLPSRSLLTHSLFQRIEVPRPKSPPLPSGATRPYAWSARLLAAAFGIQLLLIPLAGALLGASWVGIISAHPGFATGVGFVYLLSVLATGKIVWRRLRLRRQAREVPPLFVRDRKYSLAGAKPPTAHASEAHRAPSRKRVEWPSQLGRAIYH